MPKIVIQNLNNKQIISENIGLTILSILQKNQIDWMHACGGKGRCTTCKAIIINGENALDHLTEVEKKFQEMGLLKKNERLSCQAKLKGEVEIRVAEENKFPHIQYSE